MSAAYDRIRSALAYVPPVDRDVWVRTGMALKSELGEDGFNLWDQWSQADDSYREKDARAVWKSIKPAGGVTIGSLFHLAGQRGWCAETSNEGHSRPTVPCIARDRATEADDAGRHAEAGKRASNTWAAAVPARLEHPYLQRKGVKPHGVRLYHGELVISGVACDGALIVPLQDSSGAIASLEFIPAEGEKRSLPDGRRKGCYYLIAGATDTVVVAEGFATGASCHEATGHTVAVAFSAGNLAAVACVMRQKFRAARIVIAGDNDKSGTGQKAAHDAAFGVDGFVAMPADIGSDWNDIARIHGVAAVRSGIEAGQSPWPEPAPLPEGLPPVEPLDNELLPPVLHRFVADIAERMQCPPDFPAVATVVMLASVIGRRCGIAPKREDDWIVVPNLWGMIVGRPGVMKSPPMTEALRPLQVLQAAAMAEFKTDEQRHRAGVLLAEEAEKVAKEVIRRLLKDGKPTDAAEQAENAVGRDGPEPICKRYVVNDTTVEKLGEILNQNPNGVLLHRDELTGFFRSLERQGHEADRAFYLECWNGDGSFNYDRIGRGTLHIEGACLSILGGIQPGPLSDLVRGLCGGGDDGLLQRFQLAVWPDPAREWHNVDRRPDMDARDAIGKLIERLARMTAELLGANSGTVPVLRFSADAQQLFDVWREALERRLRGDTEHPTLEAHLAKFRSLVPALALVIHLTEADSGPVERLALERAVGWAEYLETHARRIYAPAIRPDVDAASALAKRIKSGEVGERFALRDVYNCGWTALSTRKDVAAAVEVLVDHDWLRQVEESTSGRPRTFYEINPGVLPAKSRP